MTLTPGARVGPYEVTAQIGAGGMGEVYRAIDTNLKRQVALKVLPAAVSTDHDRVARFQREAEVLAALNHPNIAHIFGLERSEGTLALIMELVEGPTLADRIAHGAIPTDDALRIAKQIAEALEAAHERGIVHRDLKPANIKARDDGAVKVLDFGLAKAMDTTGGSSLGATMSPTISIHATQAGIVLGTAAYMSPEQAAGKPVDKRSDLWSFGVVLLEMLTGHRVFDGETVSHVIASVLKDEPDWARLPANTPAAIRTLLRRCLEKDRKRRLDSAADARLEIEDALAGREEREGGAQAAVAPGSRWTTFAMLAGAVLVGAVIAAGGAWGLTWLRAPASAAPVRFEITPPKGALFAPGTPGARAVLSPDGGLLAFAARPGRDAANEIWVRRMDAVEATRLAGTDGVDTLFWSPDGRSIGFFARGALKRIEIAGGPPQTLCSVALGVASGTWSRAGVILYSTQDGAFRVSAEGGEPTSMGSQYAWPRFLPDGRHFLFFDADTRPDKHGVWIGALDSKDAVHVAPSESLAEFVQPDAILFIRNEALFYQAFDQSHLQVRGAPVQMVQGVAVDPNNGRAGFSVAGAGVLVYAPANAASGTDLELTVFDRSGKTVGRMGGAWPYRGVDVSPDGQRILSHRHEDAGGDIWITDAKDGSTSRLTFAAAQHNSSPIWSPDGSQVAFSSFRKGSWGLYQKAADGVGAEQLLVESNEAVVPTDWSPDGKTLVFASAGAGSAGGIWRLPLTGDRKPVALLRNSYFGRLSPDGRWITYAGGDSALEVYVESFPATGTKYQVSHGGGTVPRWSLNGREIDFLALRGGGILSARVQPVGEALRITAPELLFNSGFVSWGHNAYFGFAVTPDGQRFIIPMGQGSGTDAVTPLTVILNWAQKILKS